MTHEVPAQRRGRRSVAITIGKIAEAVQAEVLVPGKGVSQEVDVCIACDLVSDILLCPDERAFLITGLATIQLVRAADMMDLAGVLFVRGKMPPPDVVAFAEDTGLPVLATDKTMYESCGLIFRLGARAGNYRPPCNPSP
jgi:predicted transcriptional regulator